MIFFLDLEDEIADEVSSEIDQGENEQADPKAWGWRRSTYICFH